MTAPQQPPSADDAVGKAADTAGAAPDRPQADTDVVLSTDEDEQRDDLTVQPGNS